MDIKKLEKNMVNGSAAKLFPVLADLKKEEKAKHSASIFTVVPDARAVLEEVFSVESERKLSATEVFKGLTKSVPTDS